MSRYVKIFPEIDATCTTNFFCLIRIQLGKNEYFKVLNVTNYSDIFNYNTSNSFVVMYSATNENCVEQFQKMNFRFESEYDKNYNISYNFYLSFFNYLKKFKGIDKKTIWKNKNYKIESNNLERFCGIYISNDDATVCTAEEDNISSDDEI